MTIDIDPQPTDEEMAAILVAYEALWPRPSAAAEPEKPSRWRFFFFGFFIRSIMLCL